VVLLSGIELIEELGGKGGVLIVNGSGSGGGSLVSRCGGVDGGVRVSRHALSMKDAEGVAAKGGVHLAVVKRLGLLSSLAVLPLSGWWGRCVRCIVIQVPGGWQ